MMMNMKDNEFMSKYIENKVTEKFENNKKLIDSYLEFKKDESVYSKWDCVRPNIDYYTGFKQAYNTVLKYINVHPQGVCEYRDLFNYIQYQVDIYVNLVSNPACKSEEITRLFGKIQGFIQCLVVAEDARVELRNQKKKNLEEEPEE